MNLKNQPFKQKLKLESDLDYDLSYAGWGPDYLDPMTFIDMFVTDGPHNQTGYSNPKYDEIVAKGKGELLTKTKERWDSLLKAEKMLLEDAAIAPLYQRGDAIVQKQKLKVLFTIQLVEITATNGHISVMKNKMKGAHDAPFFYALFFFPRIYKIKKGESDETKRIYRFSSLLRNRECPSWWFYINETIVRATTS